MDRTENERRAINFGTGMAAERGCPHTEQGPRRPQRPPGCCPFSWHLSSTRGPVAADHAADR
jgi:hypothetical protein